MALAINRWAAELASMTGMKRRVGADDDHVALRRPHPTPRYWWRALKPTASKTGTWGRPGRGLCSGAEPPVVLVGPGGVVSHLDAEAQVARSQFFPD